ncbi:MAG: ABC transporter substrate-binding protein [Chloroflexota bacterium]
MEGVMNKSAFQGEVPVDPHGRKPRHPTRGTEQARNLTTWWAAGVLAAAVLLSACGGAAASPPASSPASGAASVRTGASASAAAAQPAVPAAAPASANLATIRYGELNPSVSDSGMLIAEAKGWFAQEGIRIQNVPFDTAAKMIAPLGTNQLDAGGGAIGAGLFNAVARGVRITVVADKASTPPGHGYQGLVVRKDLVDSGRFKTVADLKGMKIALAATAIGPEISLADLLKEGGLTVKDVDIVPLPFADMVTALANKSIDAAQPLEPFLTDEVQKGVGVLYKRSDQYAPNQQIGAILFSPKLAKNRDLATRFMVAYLKGVRLYNDAFDKKEPQARQDVINILMKGTKMKNRALYDKMVMPGLNPNGAVNVADLKAQQKYYLAAGEQQKPVDIAKVVDLSFANAAAHKLGTYK